MAPVNDHFVSGISRIGFLDEFIAHDDVFARMPLTGANRARKIIALGTLAARLAPGVAELQ